MVHMLEIVRQAGKVQDFPQVIVSNFTTFSDYFENILIPLPTSNHSISITQPPNGCLKVLDDGLRWKYIQQELHEALNVESFD